MILGQQGNTVPMLSAPLQQTVIGVCAGVGARQPPEPWILCQSEGYAVFGPELYVCVCEGGAVVWVGLRAHPARGCVCICGHNFGFVKIRMR